jgi:hypothetical protein
VKRYACFLLAVIALTVLLVPFLSDLARDVVLIELLRLAWTVDRLVDSLPQAPFWFASLFVATLVAARSLLPRLRQPGRPFEPGHRPRGQVADLALLIHRASVRGARAGRRSYFRRRLVQYLSHLGRDVFVYSHWVEARPGNRPGLARQGALSMPGGTLTTGRLAQVENKGDLPPRDASLQQALACLRAEPAAARGAVDPAVQLFVQFLEAELEVDDGPFDRSRR